MVVAQTVRLGQVTSLKVRLPGTSDPGSAPESRLIVYCDAQSEPVAVTQPQTGRELSCTGFDRLEPLQARSMNICIRIFTKKALQEPHNGPDDPDSEDSGAREWTLAQQYTLSLKNLIQSTKPAPVCIYSGGFTFVWDPEAPPRPINGHHSAAAAALRQTIGKRSQGSVLTPSLDSLNTILTFQGAIDDAVMSTHAASEEINRMVPNGYTVVKNKLAKLKATQAKIKEYHQATVAKIRETLESAAKIDQNCCRQSEDLAESNNTVTAMITAQAAAEAMPELKIKELDQKIRAQQARAATILLEIFPIEIPVDPREQLTICGLPLPAMFVINHFDPVQVGAALGLVAQLVIVLSRYLEVALPYPIQPLGSQSYITNPLIHIKGSNIFPLWTDGTLLYRLEYGLYLLRQDIQLLLASRELAVVSPFQVLANLKNLLLVVSN